MAPQLVKLMLAALVVGCCAAQIKSECFAYFIHDHIAYDMRSLKGMKPASLKTVIVIDGIVTEGLIFYDFCKPLPLAGKCEQNFRNSHAYFVTEDGRVCLNLMSSHSSQNIYDFIDGKNLGSRVEGFKVIRKKPDFEFAFQCSPDVTGEPIVTAQGNSVLVQTQHACGRINERARVLEKYRISISIFMFIFGFAFALFGYFKIFFLRHYILGTIFFYLSFYLVTALIWSPTNGWANLGIFVFSIFVGLALVILKIKSETFSGCVLGFAVGAILMQQALMLLEVKASNVG